MLFSRHTFALSVVVGVLGLSATRPAVAAEAPIQQAQGSIQLEEVIVTARRVNENVQKVPITIAVYSEEKIRQLDVNDVFGLNKQFGGLTICCQPGNAAFTIVRGINNGAPTYFNDVPADANGFSNFFDIQNVQVLKGPQGTLFGQASNAGALIYVPKKPGETFGGQVTVSVGNLGRREIQGAVDLPVVPDKILLRLAAQSYYRNGYIVNIRNQDAYGEQDYYILRPSLTIKFNDNIENTTLFQFTSSKGLPQVIPLSDFNMLNVQQAMATTGGTFASCLAAGKLACTQAQLNGGSPAAFNALRDQALAKQIQLGRYRIDGLSTACAYPGGDLNGIAGARGSLPVTTLNSPDVSCLFGWSKSYLLHNTTTWDFLDHWGFLDNWSMKNIFGMARSKSFNQPGDGDATPLVLSDGGSPRNNVPVKGSPVWSDELQLHGKMFDVLDMTLGTFHTATYSIPQVTYGFANGVHSATMAKTSSYSHAVYGQGNLDLGRFVEGLSFTAGYRYTWDKVASQTFTLNPTTLATTRITGGRYYPIGTYVRNGVSTVATTPGATLCTTATQCENPAGFGKFKSGSYTLQLSYQLNENTMFFLNNSKGYSAGGLQNVVGFERFTPDSLNNLEGGVKTSFRIAGMPTRINASYYYGWYQNVKVTTTFDAVNPATGINAIQVGTRNAAEARLKGIDFDGSISPTEDIDLGGFFAWAHEHYTRFPTLQQVTSTPPTFIAVDASSARFGFQPKYKWGLRGTYHLPIDRDKWGDLSFTVNFTHFGEVNSSGGKPIIPSVPLDPDGTGQTCTHTRTAANGYGPLSADGQVVGIDCRVPYNNLDLSLTWDDVLNHEGLQAQFIVNNVTKNIFADGGLLQNAALGETGFTPAIPRTFVLKLRYAF